MLAFGALTNDSFYLRVLYVELPIVLPQGDTCGFFRGGAFANEISDVICQELVLLGVTYYNIAIDIQDPRDTKYISNSENNLIKPLHLSKVLCTESWRFWGIAVPTLYFQWERRQTFCP